MSLNQNALTSQLIMAHRRLAELKGVAPLLPNQEILLNTLALQEAKDSSAIENIITSHDELFKQELDIPQFNNAAAKEVGRYSEALKLGFSRVTDKGKLTLDDLVAIQAILVIGGPGPGIRTRPGTIVGNSATREVIYTPPQDYDQIVELLERLLMLRIIDTAWIEHLTAMEYMRQGIGLQAMAQRDPLVVIQTPEP